MSESAQADAAAVTATAKTGEPKTEFAPAPSAASPDLDADLGTLPREVLLAEVRKLRAAIRTHCDHSAHALCWF